MSRHTPAWLRIALAWSPFWGLWLLFLRSYGNVPIGTAAVSATIAIGAAALLGVGAWWFTGAYLWPDLLRFRFYAVHLLAGSIFATSWVFVVYAAEAVQRDASLISLLIGSRILGWQLVTGLWIYGLVTGVSYAVRTRERLREQERLAAQAEAMALEARLSALRSQLNPHFLFNALHSLSVLVPRDPAAAQRAIDQLGDLLRRILVDDGEDEVRLSEEWRFTRTYLDLEQIRFGSRLTVHEDLAPDTMFRLVPCFALQTLVENAVRHGIGTSSKGGIVSVRSRLEAGVLRLEVSNTASGTIATTAPDGRRHGLDLLRERLEGLYSRAGGLTIQAIPGGGMTATVAIPAREVNRS